MRLQNSIPRGPFGPNEAPYFTLGGSTGLSEAPSAHAEKFKKPQQGSQAVSSENGDLIVMVATCLAAGVVEGAAHSLMF